MAGQRRDPTALSPVNRTGTQCTEDWVGHSADLEDYINFRRTRIRFADCSARSEWLIRLH
jgi:hypothetical protein